jgi:hypothetical protein
VIRLPLILYLPAFIYRNPGAYKSNSWIRSNIKQIGDVQVFVSLIFPGQVHYGKLQIAMQLINLPGCLGGSDPV